MSGLPFHTKVRALSRVVLGRVRVVLDRDLLEQGVADRLVRSAPFAGLLWLAIW